MITRSGVTVAVASVALVALGWLSGHDPLLVVGTAGVLLIVFALGWAGYRPHIEVDRTVDPDRVTVGTAATARIVVRNTSRRACPRLVAHETCGDEVREVPLPRLAPGESSETPYELPTSKRAVLDVGPMTLTRTDPFGLVGITRHYGRVDTLWVHPRVHPVAPMPSGRSRDLDGPTSDVAPQGGMAFHALREYVRGDDLRHIHWRSTARTGQLMVKHLVDSSLPISTVVLDTRAERYTPERRFEDAVEAAASIVVACTRHHFPVQMVTTGGDSPTEGTDLSHSLLDRFSALELSDDGSLLDVAAEIERSSQGGSLAVITGSPDEEDAATIARLRRRFELTVALRFHGDRAAGASLPIAGAITIDTTGPADFVRAWQRLASA